jgi:hypothetical protein
VGADAGVARRPGGLGRAAEGEVRRGVRVFAAPVGRPPGLLGRWSASDGQQRDRAIDEAGGDWPKELAVPGQRGGGRADGRPLDARLQRAQERPGRVGLREGRARPVACRQHRLRLAASRPLSPPRTRSTSAPTGPTSAATVPPPSTTAAPAAAPPAGLAANPLRPRPGPGTRSRTRKTASGYGPGAFGRTSPRCTRSLRRGAATC